MSRIKLNFSANSIPGIRTMNPNQNNTNIAEEEEEIICAECGECPARHECKECGDFYCDKDHSGCWVFQRTRWSEGRSEEEIAEIERKYPDGVCWQCVEE